VTDKIVVSNKVGSATSSSGLDTRATGHSALWWIFSSHKMDTCAGTQMGWPVPGIVLINLLLELLNYVVTQ